MLPRNEVNHYDDSKESIEELKSEANDSSLSCSSLVNSNDNIIQSDQRLDNHIKRFIKAVTECDQSVIIETLIELSTNLSMAQENSIPTSTLNLLIEPLIQCLEIKESTDISRKFSI